MESLLVKLGEVLDSIKQLESNFSKDTASRKTKEYLEIRLDRLDKLWAEFKNINDKASGYEWVDHPYFAENQFERAKIYYETLRQKLTSCPVASVTKTPAETLPTGPSSQSRSSTPQPQLKQVLDFPTAPSRPPQAPVGQADELMSMQRTNFRAFSRATRNIKVEEIKMKWELEEKLKRVQKKWDAIETLHLQLDNKLQGSDADYEVEFSYYEDLYEVTMRALNGKLASTAHLQNSTPKLDVPVFSGSYTQWPSFLDIFSESIHDNHLLTNCQKMQHLKGKLKGEPERLIQHLHISSENYETAWELLNHRYHNHQVLFTKHFEIFLNQPNLTKQTSNDIKRIYDTSMENIHAIQNLGIDTSTWGPALVHLICKKFDPETLADYKETRKSPRELPALQELMDFLEAKFIALEPLSQTERVTSTTYPSKSSPFPANDSSYRVRTPNHNPHYRNYRQKNGTPAEQREYRASACTWTCLYCNNNHEIYRCDEFHKLKSEEKLSTIAKLGICLNCLHKHDVNQCRSKRKCRACQGNHNSILHDALREASTGIGHVTRNQPSSIHKVNHVATEDEEALLTTICIKIKSVYGTYVTLRALLDQGSQISLISENAVQLLGLPRKSYHASVCGIGEGAKQSRGIVTINAESIYGDFHFSTQALVIPSVINPLPNSSFKKQPWAHLEHIQLADPDYNISKPIDLLLDVSVYSDIIMNGLVRGPRGGPIAQQTKLGWILSGTVKTFNCNVVVNNMPDLAQYWELEEVTEETTELSSSDKYCEELYQATTRRLKNGTYEVAIPMKPYFERDLGSSKRKAVAQFHNLENKMSANESFSESYKKFMHEYEKLGHMKRVQGLSHNSYYLPHHGVLKADSTTTKLRTVFNASSKTSSGKSLNDLMERGPNLQKDLQSLILTWRHHKYVITADIEKMFRTIAVREMDQPLQSIIWRSSTHEPLEEYHLTTVTYGTKSAPYLAMRTLQQIAIDGINMKKYPLAIRPLEGGETNKETEYLQPQIIPILSEAGMTFRKWSSNTPELTKNLPEESIDTPLDFNKFREISGSDKHTERRVLKQDQFEIPRYLENKNNSFKKSLSVNTTLNERNSLLTKLLNECNSRQRIATTIGWLARFIKWLHNKHSATKHKYLTSGEITQPLNLIVKSAQQSEFPEEIARLRERSVKKGLCHFITMALFLLFMVLTPAQSTYNFTSLDQSKDIYFDKLSNMNLIRDEWKLIVYFNMSSYWTGLYSINNYVAHLTHYVVTTPTPLPTQYRGIVYQLQQELSEVEHYNSILKNHIGHRQRRGLINGVGALANTLFGVLDDSFARRYEKDIEKISAHEDHLNQLLRNQTSVMEAQYNIMQRNEVIMNKQFNILSKELQEVRTNMHTVQSEQRSELNILSWSFAANTIITSLRRIQDNLIDTITDLSHGHMDAHLLPPEQLDNQANIISSHLRGDLTLAADKENIRDLYKLMKVNARVGERFLIIEVKIPLISKEAFELDNVISLPHLDYIVRVNTPYIAFNLQKDLLILMTKDDIQSCVHTSTSRLLCPINKPIFELPITTRICKATINNNTNLCSKHALTCQERWVKLHNNNRWLYSCCSSCNIRIFCDGGMQLETLTGNGLLDIGQGCVVKSQGFSIYGHNNYLSQIQIEGVLATVPEFSVLNNIVNSSILPMYAPENHTVEWLHIKNQIEDLKAQSNVSLNVHDIHQYTLLYITLAIVVSAGAVYIIMRLRRRARQAGVSPPLAVAFRAFPEDAQVEAPQGPQAAAGASSIEQKCVLSESISSLDKATTPKVAPRVPTIKLDIPSVCDINRRE